MDINFAPIPMGSKNLSLTKGTVYFYMEIDRQGDLSACPMSLTDRIFLVVTNEILCYDTLRGHGDTRLRFTERKIRKPQIQK